MGIAQQQGKTGAGFTIIEVILFLGITGLLALSLLGGWTTMINTQRYKDSVKTVQSFIQTQYNLVYNVEIIRDASGGPYCVVNGSGQPVFQASGDSRGQSDCIQMGRLVHISQGSTIDVFPIVGVDEEETATNDLQSIENRNPVIAQSDLLLTENELTIPWQAEVKQPGGSTDTQNVALAIVRSPLTGSVHTYVRPTDGVTVPTMDQMLTEGDERDVVLCLDPGTAFSGSRIGVIVRERASAQSFVQTIQEDGTC